MVLTFAAFSAVAGNRTTKEWEFQTPGGNFIGKNDIFFHKGVVIYDNHQKTYATFVRSSRFYPGYIAGESAEGFFIFDETARSSAVFTSADELKEAIRARQLLPMEKSEIQGRFNLTSPYVPLLMLLYIPTMFLGVLVFLRHKLKRLAKKVQVASFLVAEGVIISMSVLWLMIGIGGLFMTLNFKGESFNIDIIINASLLLLALSMIWLMLYLNDEITRNLWPWLTHITRVSSFILFAVFAFWMASCYFSPMLPAEFWQGSY